MSRGFRPPNFAVLGTVMLAAWPNDDPGTTPKEDENGVAEAGVAPPSTLPPKELMVEFAPDPNVLLNGVLVEGSSVGAVSDGDFFSPPPIPKGDVLFDTLDGKAVDLGTVVAIIEEVMFPKPNDGAEDEDISGSALLSSGFVVLYFFASLSNNCRSRPYL